jgi:hypothetical protein
VFDAAELERFLDEVRGHGVPLVIGLWPLLSVRNAEYLAYEVPGVRIPEPLLDRLRAVADAAESGGEAGGGAGPGVGAGAGPGAGVGAEARASAGPRAVPGAVRAEGIRIARELYAQVRELEGVAGVHVHTPGDDLDAALAVLAP